MFRKLLLAAAGFAAFTLAAATSSTAEAGGPYGYRSFGGYSSFGAYRVPAPSYRYPSYAYRSHAYRPPVHHYHGQPAVRYGSPYGHPYESFYGGRGYSGSSLFYSTPGFSIRIGR